MHGVDEWIAGASDGRRLALVLAVSLLLGLRHATDPDHLAAVTTLVASGRDRGARAARRLGAAWGAGHATSLFAVGLPIVLFDAWLPGVVHEGAEAAIGLVIVGLALLLLVRHSSTHPQPRARRPLGAYAIGLAHGLGGTGGVAVLLLASIHTRTTAVAALAIFAAGTAVSMTLLSSGFGAALGTRRAHRAVRRLVPALGGISFAFGVWYLLGALTLVPYTL